VEGKKVFITGAITGCEGYKEKFRKAEEELTALGHIVMNPAILPFGFEHQEYMKITLAMLEPCDAIYILPCAKDSKGAIEEITEATVQGKEIIFDSNIDAYCAMGIVKRILALVADPYRQQY